MGSDVFTLVEPRGQRVPIVLSAPHVGVDFPKELRTIFRNEIVSYPTDTDWFVHELYNFAPDLGITMIHANYSRFVIDLNRDPQSARLYNDSRKETGLVPLTTFEGEPLYKEKSAEQNAASAAELERRKQLYYWPYYREIENRISELRKTYRHVLFFDAHSIRAIVRTIQAEAFPDLILGDQDGKTADLKLISAASHCLQNSSYQFSHNHPFKGGHLTRYFGKPLEGVHALQLEMSQSVYLDDERTELSAEKLRRISPLLRETLTRLIHALETLP